MKNFIAMIEVDEDMASSENLEPTEYLNREFGWLEESGIFLKDTNTTWLNEIVICSHCEYYNGLFCTLYKQKHTTTRVDFCSHGRKK